MLPPNRRVVRAVEAPINILWRQSSTRMSGYDRSGRELPKITMEKWSHQQPMGLSARVVSSLKSFGEIVTSTIHGIIHM